MSQIHKSNTTNMIHFLQPFVGPPQMSTFQTLFCPFLPAVSFGFPQLMVIYPLAIKRGDGTWFIDIYVFPLNPPYRYFQGVPIDVPFTFHSQPNQTTDGPRAQRSRVFSCQYGDTILQNNILKMCYRQSRRGVSRQYSTSTRQQFASQTL